MLLKKVVVAVCFIAAFCAAQPVNIQGVVKDNTAGGGIAGAAVKLEIGNISATTGPDGSFALIGTIAGIPKDNRFSLAGGPIAIHHGRIRLSLAEKSPVAISVHSIGGRQIFKSEKVYDIGNHILPALSNTTGLNLYTVTIGKDIYLFKSSPVGGVSGEVQLASRNLNGEPLFKRTKASAIIQNVISVVKEGWITHRDSIRTSDATGIVITMVPNAGNMTDADGNIYPTVKIGSQVWMAENLKTTKYNDGTPIPHVTDNAEWDNLKTGAYCYYGNNAANKDKYGALYHWFSVQTGKLAPVGWRVPTESDWDTLLTNLTAGGFNFDKTTTGNKVAKSLATKTDWAPDSTVGAVGNDPSTNNASGFSGLPGGRRTFASENIRFVAKDSVAYWWSATLEEPDRTKAWNYVLKNFGKRLYTSVHYKEYALSVRLLKDN